jgi:hypothetical protein
MRYWIWPKKLRIRKKAPKVHPAHRKRRAHKSARDRLRDFGLSRFRYLWFIPILVILIIVAARLRVPKTVTVVVQSAAADSAQAGALVIRSAKYRTSIPAGYRLAVDVAWQGEAPSQEVQVELLLRDGIGSAVAKGVTPVWPDVSGNVNRVELDVPYNLKGRYDLSVRVLGADRADYLKEATLGRLTVY